MNADKKKQAQGMDAAQFGQDAQKNQNKRVAQLKARPMAVLLNPNKQKRPSFSYLGRFFFFSRAFFLLLEGLDYRVGVYCG